MDYDRAIASYGEAIRLEPNNAKFYYGRGVAFHEKQDLDRAIADYGVALALDPTQAWSRYGRAVARWQKGDGLAALIDTAGTMRVTITNTLSDLLAWYWPQKAARP